MFIIVAMVKSARWWKWVWVIYHELSPLDVYVGHVWTPPTSFLAGVQTIDGLGIVEDKMCHCSLHLCFFISWKMSILCSCTKIGNVLTCSLRLAWIHAQIRMCGRSTRFNMKFQWKISVRGTKTSKLILDPAHARTFVPPDPCNQRFCWEWYQHFTTVQFQSGWRA